MNQEPISDLNHTPKETLILQKVDSSEFKKCLNLLNIKFKATELTSLIKKLSPWLSNKKVVYRSSKGEIFPCLEISTYFIMKQTRKDDSLKFMATLLADEENCRLMFDQLPPIIKSTILRCLDQFYLPAKDVYEESGSTIISKTRNHWNTPNYEVNSPWFELTHQKNEEDFINEYYKYYLSLHPGLYHYFYRAVHPEADMLPKTENQLAKTGLHIMETEADVLKYYPIINNLYEQDLLCTNRSNKMQITVIRKCAQQIGINEFFPNAKETEIKDLRASFLLPLFNYKLRYNTLKSTNKITPVQDVLHESSLNLLPPARFYMHTLLPHLSGINTNKLDTTNSTYLLNDTAVELLRIDKNGKWISVDHIINNLLRQETGFTRLHLFSSKDYHYDYVVFKNKTTDTPINLCRIQKEVFIPYVKGILLAMASVGLLDIAYEDYEKGDTSYVDWLKYVRVTDLGKYVIGVSKTYKPKYVPKPKSYFEFDPDLLLVRTLEEEYPYKSFLKDVGTPVGSNRYLFTAGSFMKCCQTAEDVKKNIDFFKQSIGNPTTPVWTQFFSTLTERCQPFTPLRKVDYVLYQIAPENKNMIHLINTDPNIKKWVIRAEGYIFLVKTKYLDKFTKKMKELGYII